MVMAHQFWAEYPLTETLPKPVMRDESLPLVTIVTPSYQQGRFIRETIESVLSQDYPNIEHWVMDGGSTDETISILTEFAGKDPRFHWKSETDRGQADAVNKGWRRAQGQFLGWLNSDDVYYPGAIRAQVEALLENPSCGVAYGDARFTDARGNPLGRYHSRPFNRRKFLHLAAIPQPSAFFRRALIFAEGGLNVSLRYALDYDLFLRLMWKTQFIYTGFLAATYRLHDVSKTVGEYQTLVSEAIRVVETTCDEHPDALRGVKRRAVADWHWSAAMAAVGHKDRRLAWTNAREAIMSWPLRPRAGMFALKAFDAATGLTFSDALISRLDALSASRAKGGK